MKIRSCLAPCCFGLSVLLATVLSGCSGGNATAPVPQPADGGAAPGEVDAALPSTDGATGQDAPGTGGGLRDVGGKGNGAPGDAGGKGSDAAGGTEQEPDSPAGLPPYTQGYPFGRLEYDLLGKNYREWICGVFPQANGQVVLAGRTELKGYYSGSFAIASAFTLVRVNADGTMDSTFGTAGKTVVSGPTDEVTNCRAAAQTKDGKFILAGDSNYDPIQYWNIEHDGDFLVARFNQDGTLDKTFGSDGFASTTVHWAADDAGGNELATDVVVLDDGRIVVGGQTTDRTYGNDTYPALARFTADGAVDPTFGSSGTLVLSMKSYDLTHLPMVRRLLVDTDGAVLVGISADPGYSKQHFAIARLLSSGAPDPDFGTHGILDEGLEPNEKVVELWGMAKTTDGRLIAAARTIEGDQNLPRLWFHRYGAKGVVDTSFGTAGHASLTMDQAGITVGQNSLVPRFVFQPADGGILVGLGSDMPLSFASFDLIRLKANGAFDSDFGHLSWNWDTGTGDTHDSQITAAAMFDNGDIVAAGGISAGRQDNDNNTIVLHLKKN